jgi:hypothetical protein
MLHNDLDIVDVRYWWYMLTERFKRSQPRGLRCLVGSQDHYNSHLHDAFTSVLLSTNSCLGAEKA